MKNTLLKLLLVVVVLWPVSAWTQGVERELRREFVAPGEIVSFAKSTPFDKAVQGLSEVSKKFTAKVIIDATKRTSPIGVDIEGRQWREALETILRANQMWYNEFKDYIELYSLVQEEITKPGEVPRPTFKTREVRISAVFFEVNLTKLTESGINWSFLKAKGEKPFTRSEISGGLTSADQVTDFFKVEVIPEVNFGNLNSIVKLFSSYNLGKILSSPEVTVRNGVLGYIQVGQSFSIKQRDFAGNVTDQFFDVGTILRVTPVVISDGEHTFIHLTIRSERSSVTPGQISTIITKSQAETEVLLLDGEETVIGGLYVTDETTTRDGIPFLKDLPWWVFGIRYLTGFNRKAYSQRELIVLLKVELVPTLEERMAKEGEQRDLIKERRQEYDRAIQRRMK
ncbi:MAG TPA: type II and III secretion system protein [Bacteroidota bacterium]